MTTFETIAKKSRRKNRLKTIFVAVLVSLLFVLGLDFGMSRLTARQGQEVQRKFQTMAVINNPNIGYATAYFRPTSQYTGVFHVDQTKDIAGIEVAYESLELPYSLRSLGQVYNISSGYMNDDMTATYTYTNGFKLPHFFNTNAKKTGFDFQLTQDLDFIPEMTGQAVEVAVTFDKPYTFSEIAELIPDNLKINWYWIGAESDIDTAGVNSSLLGFTPNESVFTYQEEQEIFKNTQNLSDDEWKAYMEKAFKGKENLNEEDYFANAYTHFVANLELAREKNWLNPGFGWNDTVYSMADEATSYVEKYPDGKTAKFAGVILTGRAENFAQLQNQDWIYGSNIGHSVQIQPYHQVYGE